MAYTEPNDDDSQRYVVLACIESDDGRVYAPEVNEDVVRQLTVEC